MDMFGAKQKKGNRRFRRRHVLDVKLSSQQRRQTRLRRTLLVFTVLLSLFSGLLIAWRGGEWLLRRFVYDNPAFAIHHLDVETDGVISTEHIRHWAGVKLQDNLLALDIARVKRDLELVPAIESVSVERALPHTLRLRVVEREPIARCMVASASTEPKLYLFDREGVVMLPLEPQQRAVPVITNGHLPELLRVPAGELRLGRQVQSPQVLAALQWIAMFDQSSMADLVTIQDIDVSIPNLLLISTLDGAFITFGLTDFDAQINRWQLVFDHARRNGKAISSLDLSVSNNVPVTWLEASLAPPPKPKPPRATRKRHV
jgi:cell division septal protein FtsQ